MRPVRPLLFTKTCNPLIDTISQIAFFLQILAHYEVGTRPMLNVLYVESADHNFFLEMPQIQSSAPSAMVFYQHLQFFNRFSEKKPVWDAE